jgi:hypothetical protein
MRGKHRNTRNRYNPNAPRWEDVHRTSVVTGSIVPLDGYVAFADLLVPVHLLGSAGWRKLLKRRRAA